MKRGLIAAFVVFLLDRLTKNLVLFYFADNTQPVEVTSFFNLVLRWNRGISFSMFHSQPLAPYFLTIIALIICGIIVHWMMQEDDKTNILFFGLVLGGALGNIVDRLRFGAVVDFLDFHIGFYAWPAFNVADSAVCIGAFGLFLWNVFVSRDTASPSSSTDSEKDSQ